LLFQVLHEMSPKEVWIQTEHGKVRGMAAGAGPLVLGVHGWSQRNGWHTWAAFIEPLAGAGFHAVSVDMPGWGASPPLAAGPMTAETAGAVVLGLQEAMGAGSATLLGKSWGGGVALQTALDHPERVDRLVLTAPAFRHLDRLPELQQPVLLAWAKDDTVIPVRHAWQYESQAPSVELVIYEQGGHSAAENNASDFVPRVVTFLQHRAP
jgi:pimeloyl-ACP methyl ester carboxylesterase